MFCFELQSRVPKRLDRVNNLAPYPSIDDGLPVRADFFIAGDPSRSDETDTCAPLTGSDCLQRCWSPAYAYGHAFTVRPPGLTIPAGFTGHLL
jgi:hypothetical protein